MVRPRRLKDNGKHARQETHDDFILEAKRVTKKKPISWEEDEDGELQPVFAPDLMFTHEQLEPYRSIPSLFMHKERMCKLVGRPFPFQKLPTELRVEIYRYSLVAYKPIAGVIRWEEHGRSCLPRLAVSLLATCKAMRDECAQVLYGENEFRYYSEYGHLKLLVFLNCIGPNNRWWLRKLAIGAPIIDTKDQFDKCNKRLFIENLAPWTRSWDRFSGRFKDLCPPLFHGPGENLNNITWLSLCKSLFHVLESLPNLSQPSIVIPTDSRNVNKIHHYNPEELDHKDREQIWDDLLGFLRTKYFLSVPLVQLLYEDEVYDAGPNSYDRYKERHVAYMMRRLGLWDRRFAVCDKYEAWTMPDWMEEDPEEYLLDLQSLFA